ncbi:MAG: TIM44-like domain-containing protein [Alphaproteobacteria bacterium]|uniref:TIM44-like domain-containing protein n=1 Tax=Peteryoungia algae TaxID=2919917 RepID=A0ABT0CYR3_9HYPH|nr:TIM44-like domain-containing protein [Rhizobium sp. SSM4.3]MBU2327813.1 TIM44-like domain-containing protein [Alphaproteobacteria bacterium]MCJ8238324.1 TIM44-like domain-containing protein [Rhizobium sp. SSM4.3]
MRQYAKISATLALGMMVTLMAVDFAEARRASGGFGSRGTRTFNQPAITRTAPTPSAPIERTMTPRTNATQPGAAQSTAANQAARPGGLFGGLAGGLMGGLLLGGLFGMLMGTGFGGGFGFLGLLLQGLLIFFLIRFAMRMFANRQPEASGAGNAPGFGGFGGMSRDNQSGDQPRPSFQIPKIGGGAAASASAARSGKADELGITPGDLERFEELLQEMQRAYAEEDYGALRRITTPEAMSYLAEELSENATKGVRNTVRDVRLVQGDVAESWAEDKMEYATVAMRYEAIDYVVDRQTGAVVEGDPNTPAESVELWTFARRPSTLWQISAIQSAN